jgi:hypothetical protein
MNNGYPLPRRRPWHLIIVFLLLAIGIGAARTTYFLSHNRAMRLEEQSELSAIAQLGIHATSDWRFEHIPQSSPKPIRPNQKPFPIKW